MALESRFSGHYFNEVFKLSPETIRPERRITHKAYDGLNSVSNFAYYILICNGQHFSALRTKDLIQTGSDNKVKRWAYVEKGRERGRFAEGAVWERCRVV